MNLDADFSPEELKVFLEEANEQIELMDQDIVRLEKEGDDPDLLQEIFRAAHTIKGSSAMIGYQTMAELTHSMESLLDKLRNGTLTVNTEIIDALLNGLDLLKILMSEINSKDETGQDIEPAVEKLKEVAEGNNRKPKVISKPLTLNQMQIEKIKNSLAEEINVYKISVNVSKESDWPAVRCLQCLNELSSVGEILASSPSEDEIEEDSTNLILEIAVVSRNDSETIKKLISSIGDIEKVSITDYPLDEPETPETGGKPTGTPKVTSTNPEGKKRRESSRQDNSQSVRVDVEVLDSLLNVVEELVIDRSKISQAGKMLELKYPGDSLIDDLTKTSDHINKTINELQEYIMQVRMVPIGTIFSRFPRLVRDLAQSQSKKLDFQIEGADTELDRTIIEQIRDPLTHLLRNAVDHGIEAPEIRKESGKPEMATIRLSAYREQSHIVITVEDDGKGIDAKKVIEIAVKKGLLSTSKAENLTETEGVNLIFLPGISTKEKATEISGRGVGMDIVRANVENLGGTTTIETKVGQGSKFIIRLPLTVAIVQGFLISVGGAIYILPMASITETMSIESRTIQTIQGREIIRWRDSLIPLIRLNSMFGNSTNTHENQKKNLIVVVMSENTLIGLVIDEVMEPQEIVVKSLGNYLGDMEGIAGATILGDGRVALILDITSLTRLAMKTSYGTLKTKQYTKVKLNSGVV